jgi:hypothetical protein
MVKLLLMLFDFYKNKRIIQPDINNKKGFAGCYAIFNGLLPLKAMRYICNPFSAHESNRPHQPGKRHTHLFRGTSSGKG